MRFSRKSIEARYAEVAAAFSPGGRATNYPDPVTWVLLRLAVDESRDRYGNMIALRGDTDAAHKMWQNEVFRLVVDGYLLGRIEEGTETRSLRFAEIAKDASQEAGEFALTSATAISACLDSGVFSGEPPGEIKKLLHQFTMDAVGSLSDFVVPDESNSRLLGVALARAIHLGREIALVEGFYLNGRKRQQVRGIRAAIKREQAQRLQQILEQAGVDAPDRAEQIIMENVREKMRRLGQQLGASA